MPVSVRRIHNAGKLLACVLVAGCGAVTPAPRSPARPFLQVDVVVDGDGRFDEIARCIANKTLSGVPRGRQAEPFLYETEVPAQVPAITVGDPLWYAGALDAARTRIEKAYQDHGYALARATASATPSADWARVHVRVDVHTGPRLRWGDVNVLCMENETAVAPVQLPCDEEHRQLATAVRRGRWYSRARVRSALAAERERWKEAGHAEVELQWAVDARDGRADIRIGISPGPTHTIDEIVVVDEHGTARPSDVALTALARGEPYRTSRIAAAAARLREAHPGSRIEPRTDLFGQMTPRVLAGPNGRQLEQLHRPITWRLRVYFVVSPESGDDPVHPTSHETSIAAAIGCSDGRNDQ